MYHTFGNGLDVFGGLVVLLFNISLELGSALLVHFKYSCRLIQFLESVSAKEYENGHGTSNI